MYLALLGAVLLLSPAQASFTGVVRDSSSATVAGASVELRSNETGLTLLVRTASDGRFSLASAAGGSHRVLVRAAGFADVSREVSLPQSDELAFILEPAHRIEEVTVETASRQLELRENLTTRVEVLTRQALRDTGYETLGEALREIPGTLSRRGSEGAGAGGEQVQGVDSRQVLVLIDGQPLVGARGIKRGVINLDRQSIGRLDRVEVVKGASSALYGSDAIGGVINLVTREADRPFELGASVSGGSRSAVDVRADSGFMRGNWSGLLSAERHELDGFDLTPSTPDTTAPSTGRTDTLAKLKFQATPALALRGFFNGYWSNAMGSSIGETGPQADDIDEDSQNFGGSLDWQAGRSTTIQARAYQARFGEISRGTLLSSRAALETGELFERVTKFDASVATVLGARHLLQAGAEHWGNEYSGVNRVREPEGESVSTSVAWVQDRISLTKRLSLTLGARFDDHSTFGTAISPKVALLVKPSDRLSLRASYGRGFRAPDVGQLYYRFLNPTNLYQVIGNTNLKPEYANSLQFGSEWNAAGGRARLGINLYRNRVRDLIESVSLGFAATPAQLSALLASNNLDPTFRPVAGRLLFTYKNVADARTQGIESDFELVLGRGFSLAGAYTLIDATDQVTSLELTGRNRHQAMTRLGWRTTSGGTRVNLRGSFQSGWLVSRSATAAGLVETRAPGYEIWGAYLAQRLATSVEVFASVDNLLDERDPNQDRISTSGAPLPIYRAEYGRALRVGVRFELPRVARR